MCKSISNHCLVFGPILPILWNLFCEPFIVSLWPLSKEKDRHQSLHSSASQFCKSKAFTFTESEFLTIRYLNFKKIYMYFMIKKFESSIERGRGQSSIRRIRNSVPLPPKDGSPPPGSFTSVTSIPHVEPGSSATMGHSMVSGKTAQHHHHLHRPLLQHHWSIWALRINQSQPRHTNIISHVKVEKSSTFQSVICLIPIRQLTSKKVTSTLRKNCAVLV